jgi:hypothetical protein
MHERYFYLAEVLTVIAAFYLPRRLWYVPVLVQVASFLAYLTVLFAGGGSMFPGDPPGYPGIDQPAPGNTSLAAPGESPVAGFIMEGMPDPFAPTLEFRILAALMVVAVVSVLWTTFREFRRDSPSGVGHPLPPEGVRR